MAEGASTVTQLFVAIVEAMRAEAGEGQDPQQVALQRAMSVFAGNWGALDACRVPVQQYIATQVGWYASAGFPDARGAYVEHMADASFAFLSGNTDINVALSQELLENTDPFAFTRFVLKKHLRVIADGFLDYDDAKAAAVRFHVALRDAVLEMVGEWLDGLAGMLRGGCDALPALMRSFGNTFVQAIVATQPQHAHLAQFGVPMAVTAMERLHEEYRARHPRTQAL